MTDQATSLRQLVGNRIDAPVEPTSSALPEQGEREAARILAVTSGKGGVGKSNLAVNLAIAFRREGKRVIVIDADLGMANVEVLMGRTAKYDLLDLLNPEVTLQDVLLDGPEGIRYISGGSGMEQAAEFTDRERRILMQKLAGCGELADIILVDTGAGLGRNVLDFILAADEVILVTTPEPTALTDAYAVLKAYSMYAANPNMKLIVNRVYDPEESMEVSSKLTRTAEKFLKLEVESLGYIFEDRQVIQAVRKQKPIMEMFPNSTAAKCIAAIAQSILYGRKVLVKKGWRTFLQYFLDFSN